MRDLAGHPGRALYSLETCAENVPHLLRVGDTLQPLEQQFVRNTEREAELEGQRPEPGAFTMPVAMPGVAGR